MFRLFCIFLAVFVIETIAIAMDYRLLTTGDFPSWSPDDARIAYSEGGSIKIIDADGSGDVIELVKGGNARVPDWSPDGSMIVFISDKSGNDEIWVVKSDGTGEPIKLTNCEKHIWGDNPDPMAGDLPTWSPDGGSVVFWSGWGLGAPGFKTIPFDAANPGDEKEIKILIDAESEGRLSFSPDGSMIAYDAEVFQNRDIWMANANGTGRRRLTDDEFEDLHPDWVSKRQFAVQIVFVSDRETGQRNLWLMDASGGEPVMLTEKRKSGEYKHPCWSNDGTRIAFGFNNELWIASQLPKDILGYAVSTNGSIIATWGKLKGIAETVTP